MAASNVIKTGVDADGLRRLVRSTIGIGGGDLSNDDGGGFAHIKGIAEQVFWLISQLATRSAPLAGDDDPQGAVPGFRGQLYYRRTTAQWYCNTSPVVQGSNWTEFPF